MKYLVEKGVPSADYAWNYCDLKCLYFEHYYSAFDFVYINFSEGIIKPQFRSLFHPQTHQQWGILLLSMEHSGKQQLVQQVLRPGQH